MLALIPVGGFLFTVLILMAWGNRSKKQEREKKAAESPAQSKEPR